MESNNETHEQATHFNILFKEYLCFLVFTSIKLFLSSCEHVLGIELVLAYQMFLF